MLNVGLIGCGYWGPNLLRNLNQQSQVRVIKVADIKKDRREYVQRNYPQIQTCEDSQDILTDSEIQAVAIATEAKSHYAFAKSALEREKHVLVEKPMATSSLQAEKLITLAEDVGKVLMVGHTFLYNTAVSALKKYLQEGEAGEIYYICAQRLNLGRVRQDINALWNLAPHDISILNYILSAEPMSVSARGVSYIQEGIEDVVFLILTYPQKVTAHVHVSWLNPNKVRRFTIVGSKKMMVYDDIGDAKIQIYDKGITKKTRDVAFDQADNFGEFQLIQRAGDILIPQIHYIEPLQTECAHFVDCIEKGTKPISDGRNGLEVIRVLEAAEQSLHSSGKEIFIHRGDKSR
jgi:predicted dehydrogenase